MTGLESLALALVPYALSLRGKARSKRSERRREDFDEAHPARASLRVTERLGVIDVDPAFRQDDPGGSIRQTREKTMQLGFIGTGEITSSIVTGLCSLGTTSHSIHLSPRNAAVARELSKRFRGISVASSNQEVLDHSDTTVIAVRPAATRGVLSELRFGPGHQIISVVSGLSLMSLSQLVRPATRITRAVPLPSTARRLSPTAIYPTLPAAVDLFAKLGTVFPVETEKEFDAICATTATIASYFALVERIASWLAQQGIPESKARDYVGRLFFGLTTTAVEAPERNFQSFAANHATAGGINEQFLAHLIERGLLTSVSEALDAVLHRISARSQTPDARAVL